jgi:hypothetical protein
MALSWQRLHARLLWFGVGAILNYVLITTPFSWLSAHTRLPVWAISGLSVGLATAFFFVWNYYVNFRTEARARTVVTRYLVAVAAMWLLASALLTWLKHIDMDLALRVGTDVLDFDVIGTQVFLGGLKFLLYHKWVFPAARAS